MQLQADLLGLPVEVAAEQETTALGVAALAAGGEARVGSGAVYEPRLDAGRAAEERAHWRAALARARSDFSS
jgi:glycerol kinase